MEESFVFLKPHKRHLLTKYPLTDVKISLSGKGIHSHQRFPLVRGDHDLLIVRDRAEDRDSKDIRHIFHRHHIPPPDHIHPDPVHDEIHL